MSDSVTVLQDVGTGSGKKTLAILGDGFAAGADQTTYDDYVRTHVLEGVFESDYFNEDTAAWNIRRVNLESVDSVVTLRTWDLHGTDSNLTDDTQTTVAHDTALGIVSNGEWWHNWFENGANTQSRIDSALATWAPGADFVLIVVNSPLEGGLRNGTVLKVTIGEAASTIAHELGHGFGNLADEYSAAGKGAYTGGESDLRVNVTTEKRRTTLKWRQWVNPATPVPTGVGSDSGYTEGTKPAGWDDQADAGLFEGAHTYETGVYRPAVDCRMRHNADEFCPVCYTELKGRYHGPTGRDFLTTIAGHFTAANRVEVIGVAPRGISLYRASGQRWAHVHTTAGLIRGGWGIRPGDRYTVGDFDGDGRDEVLIYNPTHWTIPLVGLVKFDGAGVPRLLRRYDADIPGWDGLRNGDFFLAGDLDGDGKDDLVVVNLTDWAMPYVGTLISNGFGFTLTHRYDGDIPGWGGLARHDEFFLADLRGGGHHDLLVWNADDWAERYLGLFRMRAGVFHSIRMYTNDLPGWGGFADHDELFVADFDGDGKDDLYLFNGRDWANPYLGMFRSKVDDFSRVQLYDGDVPGWGGLREHDHFLPADLEGTGRTGLFAWNVDDWGPTYAGRMVSDGNALHADWREDWVGEWHVGSPDRFTRLPAPPPVIRLGGVVGTVGGLSATTAAARRRAGRVSGSASATTSVTEVVREVTGPGGRLIGKNAARVRLPEGIRLLRSPDRVLAHNTSWLGTFRTKAPLELDSIYYRWVHDYRYGRNW